MRALNTAILPKVCRPLVFVLGLLRWVCRRIGQQANTDAIFRQNLPVMETAKQSFHAITDKERELAKPLRLRVITARAGLTFAELAKTSPLGRFAEGHLRVINGLYPAGEPTAGQTLKIIE